MPGLSQSPHVSQATPEQRSRLNSIASVTSNGTMRGRGSGPQTPVEAKGFLLDYLNGVVAKEGNRGQR